VSGFSVYFDGGTTSQPLGVFGERGMKEIQRFAVHELQLMRQQHGADGIDVKNNMNVGRGDGVG